ncbi:hypothetical protein AO063_26135 [Pseudomonas fluorescens ICMP 11288]|uniref:Uncharacterized protein n=1 Tax=Pseudomonas fluorescens ICMP 11288 TaxID=1198309 RepID=A0A0W0HZQ7_PSEFL|nr:hypothetical protein AO063_26135 [Pseudomonas fluorescens ICMP 11288]
MGAAITTGLHLFGRQLGVNLLQQACLVDSQAAVIAGLTYSHVFVFVIFMQRNHPEHGLRAIQASVGLAEYFVPWLTDFG